MKRLIAITMLILNVTCFSIMKGNSEKLIFKKLNNGMTYYFYKNNNPKNRASVNIIVNVGSLQEGDNQLGLAHFLEHMCFNGSDNYKKNDIIKYFQAIGLSFGRDLNAHTSFNETTYKLKLCTDNKVKFEKGIEILSEMIFKPSLNQEDIESEKKIIMEEWRLEQGISNRIYENIYQEAIFKNSQYEKRKIIGDINIIKNIKKEDLKSFYDKWYTPENMAIVVVGDLDEKYLDGVINKNFGKKINKKLNSPQKYSLKELEDNFIIFRDSEIKIPEFQMTFRKNRQLIHDEKYFKDAIGKMLLKNILKNKYTMEINLGNRSLLSGGISWDDYTQDTIETVYGVLTQDWEKEGIKTIYKNLKIIGEEGVSEGELNLEKRDILNTLEMMVKNKNSIHNEKIIKDINQVFIKNGLFLSPEETLEVYSKYVNEVDSTYIKNLTKSIYNDKATYILYLPKNENKIFENEKEFKKFIECLKKEKVKNPDFKIKKTKLNKIKLKEGEISSFIQKENYKEIKLSNGIEVFYKKTNFKKDEIIISLTKEEGSSNENDIGYLNTLMASSMIVDSGAGNISSKDLNMYMKGKKFKVIPFIEEYTQGVKIISTKKDLEEALEYFLNIMLNPKIDNNIYNINMEGLKKLVNNRENSSEDVFEDKIIEILYRNNLRKRVFNEEELNKIEKAKMLEVYKNKFSNFNDYKLVIVGTIEEERLKNILKKYFASLPVDKSINKKYKKNNISYPIGYISDEVVRGNDKKIKVNIFYPIKVKYSQENKYLANTLSKILKINLTDKIREEMGGVYGISTKVIIDKYEQGLLLVEFSTDPKKQEEVVNGVLKEIKKINEGKIDLKVLNSIKENYKNIYENNQNENYYWAKFLENKIMEKEIYKEITPEKYNELVEKNRLSEFAKKFIDKKNYIKVVLKPQQEKK
ncbi:M16 family metallopeptidase [Fusobacterium sp. MFO224]|uniref:M16 family metallopeptidase n=1 Tax=Fusobacterium sp. MFO224 TaxID=3378070 RepID=UPI003854A0ED